MSRIIASALAAVALTATAASANSYFDFTSERQDRGSVVELNTVTADGNGVVEIYDFQGGEVGDLLGTKTVTAGANSNVRVNIGAPSQTDAIALLKIDGEVVATQEIDFR